MRGSLIDSVQFSYVGPTPFNRETETVHTGTPHTSDWLVRHGAYQYGAIRCIPRKELRNSGTHTLINLDVAFIHNVHELAAREVA